MAKWLSWDDNGHEVRPTSWICPYCHKDHDMIDLGCECQSVRWENSTENPQNYHGDGTFKADPYKGVDD